MRTCQDWLRVIAAAHATGTGTRTERGITIQRIRGGNNNALYRVEADGQVLACKLCVPDERHRAAREYAALDALHGAGLDIAPEPLWLDESCEIVPYPAVAYRWLSGEPLGASVTDEQLDAVLASVQLMHTLEPEQSPKLADTWLHWFDFGRYLPELDEFMCQYGPWLETSDPEGRALAERLAQLRDNCKRLIAATRVNPGRAHIALRICRADTNLANAIWDDEARVREGRVRWVDWEYSGRCWTSASENESAPSVIQ